jgi:membrane-bound lytic murein transglycosylase B
MSCSALTPSAPVSRPLRIAMTPIEQVADELLVARLEDVQRQPHAWEQHRGQREQGQHLAHVVDIIYRPACKLSPGNSFAAAYRAAYSERQRVDGTK